MVIGMFMVTTTDSLVVLGIWRIITGVGIGGMLAAINAQAAEYSNDKRRPMSIAIMAAGYPIGGVVGGFIVSRLLEHYDWRSVFYFGTAVTALMIPIVYLWMPESVHWLVRKKPENVLERINAIMSRLGHRIVDMVPEITEVEKGKAWVDLFNKRFMLTTILLALAY